MPSLTSALQRMPALPFGSLPCGALPLYLQRIVEQVTASADSLKPAPIKDNEFEELDR